MAFAVLENTAVVGAPVMAVDVQLAAISGNGFAPVHTAAHVAGIAAGTRQAVAVPVSIPSGDNIDHVTAAASSSQAAGAQPATINVGTPAYVLDPIQPTATVTLSSSSTITAIAVVICWSSANAILGGGEKEVSLAANAHTTASVALALQDVPDHCTGYARLA
jgi:hypothetical protein